MNTIAEIADVLKKLKSAVIFTHMRPDGDTLGGALALSRALSFLNVKNEVVNEGEIPERFLFLAGAKKILRRPSFEAEGYLYINCLWIAGSMKGHGYSNDLLDECIRDARAQGRKGLCIFSAQ
ncbi:MAG: bifunctional oligoribonuclease/PAP phosphatase NrnA, partial [Candidatus Gallimonas sp.]